jgi:aerobic carbon-monoxide dehydrogenase medium subunit
MQNSFEVSHYLRPKTVDEALLAIDHHGKDGIILAGGTNLFLEGAAGAKVAIDIRALALSTIRRNEHIHIGALATVADIRTAPELKGPYYILKEAADLHGHNLIMHLATIGGNVANAHPVLDFPPCLLALDAVAILRSSSGDRRVPLTDFFVGFKKTALRKNELIADFELGNFSRRSGGAFLKLAWSRVDMAVINLATVIELAEDGTCSKARIALGTAGPIPFRAEEAEALLMGKKIDDILIDQVAKVCKATANPVDYFRGSIDYKKHIIEVYAQRGLRSAVSRATEEV